MLVERVVQLGHERARVRDQFGIGQRREVGPIAPKVEHPLQVGVDHRERGAAEQVTDRLADLGRARRVESSGCGSYGRRDRRVAQHGRVERVDVGPHPHRHHPAVREVDVEVAAEQAGHRRAVERQLVLLVDAEVDQALQPTGQQAALEDERPAERARRVGQHLAGVGPGVVREPLEALPVGQPAVGQMSPQLPLRHHHWAVPPSTLSSAPVMPPPTSVASSDAIAATSSTVLSRLIEDSCA